MAHLKFNSMIYWIEMVIFIDFPLFRSYASYYQMVTNAIVH